MEVTTNDFLAGARKALRDPQIQTALAVTSQRLGMGPQLAEQELTTEVWQSLREQASSIKRHTLDHLDYYLEQLDDNVTQAGGVVHYAKNAAEANEIVLDIAQRHNVRLAVKGKSMISEEAGTNHALAQQDIEAVETDLGEYILQLAQETPFHIVAPALHKSREEVAELFSAELGTPAHQEAEELCQSAREALREKFLQADMGITGVNFAVAETGTIVLVTNEGNGRMCTTLPKIQVAMMGMEKVIPRMQDLGTFLRLLPRAATGQRATSYFTFSTGPRRYTDEDGPEELHLVVVDNGRSRMLADPELREALHCIRCGACLNTCPIYRKIGGHAYGWVYSGPIGAVITPMLTNPTEARHLPFASTLCGACGEVCPVKINLPHLLLRLRREITEGGTIVSKPRQSFMERIFFKGWRQAMTRASVFGLTSRLGRLTLMGLSRGGKVRWLPPPLTAWTKSRDFPSPPRLSFRQRWEKGIDD